MTTFLYALLEQRPGHANFGQPIYIGIGTAQRPYAHMKRARSRRGHPNVLLHACLIDHLALGVEPKVEIVGSYPTFGDAGRAEQEQIKRYGRIAYETGGILCNLAKGGEGADPELLKDPEILARIAATSRARWADPEYRARLMEIIHTQVKDVGWLKRVSEETAKAINEPEARAKHVAALRRISASISREQKSAWGKNVSEEVKQRRLAALEANRSDPEVKARHAAAMSASMKKAWADPEKRAARAKGMRGVKKTLTEAALAARRANAAKSNTPEANAKKGAASRRCWDDPDYRAKQAEKRRAVWQDPVKRANVLAGRARAKAARLATSGTHTQAETEGTHSG